MPWREQLERQHARRVEEKLWRRRRKIASAQGPTVVVDGQTLLNFCSNDYLGLANHPALASAAIEAITRFGNGSGASHLICGHADAHEKLEQELADFVGAESAIVFSTGYMANLAIPQTFLERGDLVLEDRLNHASLLDAGRFCEATLKRYRHLDMASAQTKLARSNARRKLIATDGVFSMDGDVAPINDLKKLCDDYSAMLLVDDAHGIGVLGDNGAGSLEQAEVKPAGNVLLLGTLGKAFGSFGAFVAGDQIFIESLVQFARSYIYTTALPPAVAATSLAALAVIKQQPALRTQLQANVDYFCRQMSSAGIPLQHSNTAIQPILMRDNEAAIEASERLEEKGIWVTAIRPPTVPAGSSRLRVTISAAHTEQDIDRLVAAIGADAVRRLIKGAIA